MIFEMMSAMVLLTSSFDEQQVHQHCNELRALRLESGSKNCEISSLLLARDRDLKKFYGILRESDGLLATNPWYSIEATPNALRSAFDRTEALSIPELTDKAARFSRFAIVQRFIQQNSKIGHRVRTWSDAKKVLASDLGAVSTEVLADAKRNLSVQKTLESLRFGVFAALLDCHRTTLTIDSVAGTKCDLGAAQDRARLVKEARAYVGKDIAAFKVEAPSYSPDQLIVHCLSRYDNAKCAQAIRVKVTDLHFLRDGDRPERFELEKGFQKAQLDRLSDFRRDEVNHDLDGALFGDSVGAAIANFTTNPLQAPEIRGVSDAAVVKALGHLRAAAKAEASIGTILSMSNGVENLDVERRLKYKKRCHTFGCAPFRTTVLALSLGAEQSVLGEYRLPGVVLSLSPISLDFGRIGAGIDLSLSTFGPGTVDEVARSAEGATSDPGIVWRTLFPVSVGLTTFAKLNQRTHFFVSGRVLLPKTLTGSNLLGAANGPGYEVAFGLRMAWSFADLVWTPY